MSPGFPTEKRLSDQAAGEAGAADERDSNDQDDELLQSESGASQDIGGGLGFAFKVENERI